MLVMCTCTLFLTRAVSEAKGTESEKTLSETTSQQPTPAGEWSGVGDV